MSEKGYNTLDYYAQAVQDSLKKVLKNKVGTDVTVRNAGSEKIHTLSYLLSRAQMKVDVTVKEERLRLESKVSEAGVEDGQISTYQMGFKIERTSKGKMSERQTDSFAEGNFKFFKDFCIHMSRSNA